MQITRYTIAAEKLVKPIKIAHVSDIHGKNYDIILQALKNESVDIIAISGDLVSRKKDDNEKALAFLSDVSKISKTFYVFGNHENILGNLKKEDVKKTGVIFLDDSECFYDGIYVGGLSSAQTKKGRGETPAPNTVWLESFEKLEGFKLLLSHHPEYYPRYIKKRDIDLILSGHAHGGQWRFFGQGIFAPGQGLFPKYTSGVHDNRLVVSRGLGDGSTKIPRINNKRELVIITVKPKK